mgnify:CR=1 FL=1
MNISYDSYRVFYYAAKFRSFSQAAAALLAEVSGGTVRLVGDVGRLDRGPHLLVAASDVALGKWSVAFAGTVNRAFALRRTAEGVCLLVADKGTALIFR